MPPLGRGAGRCVSRSSGGGLAVAPPACGGQQIDGSIDLTCATILAASRLWGEEGEMKAVFLIASSQR